MGRKSNHEKEEKNLSDKLNRACMSVSPDLAANGTGLDWTVRMDPCLLIGLDRSISTRHAAPMEMDRVGWVQSSLFSQRGKSRCARGRAGHAFALPDQPASSMVASSLPLTIVVLLVLIH